MREILNALDAKVKVPEEPEDLEELARVIEGRSLSRVALLHFDVVKHRPDYDVNLYAALRHLMAEKRKLVLLIVSRAPLAVLLPKDNPLSAIPVTTVELEGRG